MNEPDIQYVDVLPTDSPESVADKIETAILITNGTKSMRRDRPYSGQRHTCLGQRGQQEVSGVTMRDIYDCFVRGFILSHPSMSNDGKLLRSNDEIIREALKGEGGNINGADIYKLTGDIDPVAVIQNAMCEIERIMGIFPNIPKDKE